jgi:hypothetical protein
MRESHGRRRTLGKGPETTSGSLGRRRALGTGPETTRG